MPEHVSTLGMLRNFSYFLPFIAIMGAFAIVLVRWEILVGCVLCDYTLLEIT